MKRSIAVKSPRRNAIFKIRCHGLFLIVGATDRKGRFVWD